MSQQINLFNPLYLRREKHFSAATILWSLLATAVALFAYAGYVNYAIRGPVERARYFESMVKYKRSEMTDTVARYSPEGRNKKLEADVRALEIRLAANKEGWRALHSLEMGTGSGVAGHFQTGPTGRRGWAALSRRALPRFARVSFSGSWGRGRCGGLNGCFGCSMDPMPRGAWR